MTIKRIYGISLDDARQRARSHYGEAFITLEAREAGDNGNAYISIMIEEDAAKEYLSIQHIQANGKAGLNSKPAGNGSHIKADKPGWIHRNGSGTNGQTPKTPGNNEAVQSPEKKAGIAPPINNRKPEVQNRNSMANKTRKLLNSLLGPFRSSKKNEPAGPVIRRESQVLHPGVMYKPSRTVAADRAHIASSANVEPLAEAGPESKTDTGNRTGLDLSGVSLNTAIPPANPDSQNRILPETTSRLPQEKPARVAAPGQTETIAGSSSCSDERYSVLRQQLVEAGFSERFALTLAEMAGKERSNPGYRDIRWHLESALGKLFVFEPGSTSQCFTGLPGSGRTTLIRSILNHPGGQRYHAVSRGDAAPGKSFAQNETISFQNEAPSGDSGTPWLVDAPPLPAQNGDRKALLKALYSQNGCGLATVHIVADANLDMRTLGRLAALGDAAPDIRFSFTRLNEPGNVAKVLEFLYTSICRPGYLYREGLPPATGIHVLLRMLDLTVLETNNRNNR